MSNYKVKGTITKIGEKKELNNGAVALDYVVEHTSENGYKTLYSFNMYKKAEYAEHVDNFLKFNKVGDEVEVEFTISGREHNDRIYNQLNHWKIESVNKGTLSESLEEEGLDLPF